MNRADEKTANRCDYEPIFCGERIPNVENCHLEKGHAGPCAFNWRIGVRYEHPFVVVKVGD